MQNGRGSGGMNKKSIQKIIHDLVLANHDNDMRAVATVYVNSKGELLMDLSFGEGDAFFINAGLDMVKFNLLEMIMRNGMIQRD
jgi:hypothetical protein